jgi:hypothetical protein
MAVTGATASSGIVRSSMRQLQNYPKKSAPSIKNPLSNTPREHEVT